MPALDLIGEATDALRRAPAGVLLAYYVGSLPAILGLLYFFVDMSRGAFARAHLIEASLGTAALYVWMKSWHTVFMSGLHASIAAKDAEPWSAARLARMIATQAALQPVGLFARFFSAQILVPYVWVYGFFQSASVLGDGTSPDLGTVMREAAAQARLWPRQAHFTLLLLFLFAFVVAINSVVALFIVPQLLKTFLGIETVFSQSPMAMLNTTLFAAVAAVTYLVFDPLRKAAYVVRCFHGASLRTGNDLAVELRRIRGRAQKVAVAAALVLLFAAPLPGIAAPAPPPAAQVDSQRLDQTIDEVLQRREFAWRMPREKVPDSEKGWLTSFVEEFARSLGRMVSKALEWVGKIFQKLRHIFGSDDERGLGRDGSGWSFATIAKPLLYGAVALIGIILAVLLIRMRRGVQKSVAIAEPSVIPDLTSEDVTADQLPEDGWLKLARELMQSGELRLALRASYLAGLAHLGQRQLITLARHKSNYDYDRELQRRARTRAELLAAFEANLAAFERAWYGLHEVTPETLGGFNQNLETIRSC